MGSKPLNAILLVAVSSIWMFFSAGSPTATADRRAEEPTAADLGSMTFRSSYVPARQVTLTAGEYREPASGGSAAIHVQLSAERVFGRVKGKPIGATILVTQTGGTGIFKDLALLSKEADGWTNSDSLLLGDRVQISSLRLDGETIVVAMKIHGPTDPMCCPTRDVTRRFSVQNDKLLPLSDAAPGAVPAEASAVAGPLWQWIETRYEDGKRLVPEDPKKYTVQFLQDGKLNIKADCNRKGGTYVLQGRQLHVEVTHSTMAACPDDSLEGRFIQELTAVTQYLLENGNGHLELAFAAGTIHFAKVD